MTATRSQKITPGGDVIRRVVQSINQIIDGRVDCYGEVTLTASATSTSVADQRVAEQSVIVLSPLTANAAAALSTTYVQAANIDNGGFAITHANNAQTDRTFRYAIIG